MLLRSLFIAFLVIGLCPISLAQIVAIVPAEAAADDEVEVFFDAALGTAGLKGASSVYMHSGVITSGPDGADWSYVIGNWGEDDGIGKMTKVAGQTDKWSFKIAPSIREYYGVPEGANVFRLSMVFRNADGSSEGKGTPGNFEGGTVAANGDIFVDLEVSNYVQLVAPAATTLFVEGGTEVTFKAQASGTATKVRLLLDNGGGYEEVASVNNAATVEYDYVAISSANFSVKAEATFGTIVTEDAKEYSVNVRAANEVAALPAGARKGINYSADLSKVTLVLEAPEKEFVYVVGDFTDWKVADAYLMKQTPDGELFWLEVSGLEAGQPYVFQYWVEGTIKVGDPYAELVADPWNDQYIPSSVFPNIPFYNKTTNGIATVLQTGQEPYVWSSTEANWQRPDKQELVIYELLLRDFIGSHSYDDLTDTLSYLKRLGVNAIELMPIMEFEGNESWGYNPSYFFAPDKYYGRKDDLKAFIEAAHANGMAVILDMVLNHAFGQNAMVRMYWDQQASKPSTDNPWFNPDATHPFNVGYDFNHESTYTQALVDSVNHYWLSEYHFDGFRFDLSKGFTQRVNTDVGLWSQKDDSRIALLKRMASKIRQADPEAYIILEHFAAQAEENELIADGMLVWGNSTHDYGDLLTGKTTASITAAGNQSRVSYMESHDEERLMYKAGNSGAGPSYYTVKDPAVGLERVKMLAAFFYTLPGPKMMWQFQELGYDVSINFNGRVGNKPLVWGPGSLGYYDQDMRQDLYKAHAAIIGLVNEHREVFTDGQFDLSLAGEVKTIEVDHSEMDVTIAGNFALSAKDATISFSHIGIWYDYFTGEPLEVSAVTTSFTFQPGEFHIYTDQPLASPAPGILNSFSPIVTTNPLQFTASTEVTLTFDPSLADPAGTEGLLDAEKVFMVAGVVTSTTFGETLEYLKGESDGAAEMTRLGDKWTFTLKVRDYFGVPEEESIYRMGVYFRSEDGTALGKGADASTIYLNLKSDAQIVTVDPADFRPHQEITITFDAVAADPAGTAGLVGATKVYMHSGLITSGPEGTEWGYVVGNWGQDDGVGAMTKVAGEDNLWSITITPRDYYEDVPANLPWYRLGMVFRNADGSLQGKGQGGEDIFVNFGAITPVSSAVLEQSVVLYPNPTNGVFNINSPKKAFYTITVWDMTGRIIRRERLVQPQHEYEFSVSSMPTGTYLIGVMTGDGTVVQRIVIE